jgi:hypothetical protein
MIHHDHRGGIFLLSPMTTHARHIEQTPEYIHYIQTYLPISIEEGDFLVCVPGGDLDMGGGGDFPFPF